MVRTDRNLSVHVTKQSQDVVYRALRKLVESLRVDIRVSFQHIPLFSTPRAERLASSFFLSRTMRSLIASRRPVMVTPTSRSNSGSGFQLMTESGSTCHLIGLLG